MLTDAQRTAYDRDGFIVIPDLFSAQDIAELRRVTDEFVAASAMVAVNDSITTWRKPTRRSIHGCAG